MVMAMTKIEWADRTINTVTGCTPISPGCANCYAKRMAKRLAGRCGYPEGDGFAVTLHPEKLGEIEALAKVKKPQRFFVGSMTDLFHPEVPFEFLRRLWADMSNPFVKHHTFLILTKRPERMKEFFSWMRAQEFKVETYLSHVWVGVTAENQEQADKRIPILLQVPVSVRFVSVEPMLGPVNINRIDPPGHDVIIKPLDGMVYWLGGGREYPGLDWVICGGETGPGARLVHPNWVSSLRDQCQAAGTPFFFKQWGEWWPAGRHIVENARMVDFGGEVMYQLGKKKAGRLLDGREWSEFPVPR